MAQVAEKPSRETSGSDSAERGQNPPSVARAASPPPNGGMQAWLVALGAFCALICTFGYLNSFGVFQSYYQSHFLKHESPSNISWIGSLQVFLLFLGGLVSGPLGDRYGIKAREKKNLFFPSAISPLKKGFCSLTNANQAVLVPASIVLVFSVMMTSLATDYYQFILAQGVVEGFSCGMIFTPTVSTVGQYFTTKRAWAMGVVVSGASIGGVIFPIALNRLLSHSSLGFGWTLRVIGFIMLALLTFACAVMREHAPPRRQRFWLPEAFRSGPYVFALLSFFFTLFGLWSPIFYIVDYATARGMSLELAFYQVSILNATSFFGRTLPGFAADRAGRFNTNILMTMCSAVLIFCWSAAQSNAAITVFIALYGFFAGAVVSLVSPCLAQVCPRPSDIGTYIGMALAVCSLGGLAGTPINGALIARYGFLSASMFSAVMVFVGGLSGLAAKLLLNRNVWAVV